jgi:hypothetical protein
MASDGTSPTTAKLTQYNAIIRLQPPICRHHQLPTRRGPGIHPPSVALPGRAFTSPDSGAGGTADWLPSCLAVSFQPQLPLLPNKTKPISPCSPRMSPFSRFNWNPRCNAANPCSPSPAKMDGSSLKSAQLLEQMRLHLATDAGKELTKKVGLVYQLNIAPKVRPIPPRSPRIDRKVLFFFLAWTAAGWAEFLILFGVAILQKLGVDEEIYVVDLKKGEVTKGLSFNALTLVSC